MRVEKFCWVVPAEQYQQHVLHRSQATHSFTAASAQKFIQKSTAECPEVLKPVMDMLLNDSALTAPKASGTKRTSAQPRRSRKRCLNARVRARDGGHWYVQAAHLRAGDLVDARFNGGAHPSMQEHYKARVLDDWEPHSKIGTNKMIRVEFLDAAVKNRIMRLRRRKSAVCVVPANDVQQCRVGAKTEMFGVTGLLTKSCKVSVRYIFNGARVKGWSGLYSGSLVEFCEDGTLLVEYDNEESTHLEYLTPEQVQFAPMINTATDEVIVEDMQVSPRVDKSAQSMAASKTEAD